MKRTALRVLLLICLFQVDFSLGQQTAVPQWEVITQTLHGEGSYANPFVDVKARALLTSPGGTLREVDLFYDGQNRWTFRFSPGEQGLWRWQTQSVPEDEGLRQEGDFRVTAPLQNRRGFLRTRPGESWGFEFDDGSPVFLLGDTMYNLFGAAACGEDYRKMLLARQAAGFNLFRARMQVSPFHPPRANNAWQDRSLWPWGGTKEAPDLFRLNLDWFRVVDEVVQFAQKNHFGLEIIFEAWGFEFPFNDRSLFNEEAEDFWIRYIVSRYGAYRSVYYWTLLNEYEYYPDGDWDYTPEADPWAENLTRKVKDWDAHGHPVAIHNGPRRPLFTERFSPETPIDLFLYQIWGTREEESAWLAGAIDEEIALQKQGLSRPLILSEWGYERTRDIPITFDGFRWLYADHNRRGAWRGIFSGVSIITGFQTTWAPFFRFEEPEGLAQISLAADFVRHRIPFASMEPRHELVETIETPVNLPEFPYRYGTTKGTDALVLVSNRERALAAYLPIGGKVRIRIPFEPRDETWLWLDPLSGEEYVADVEVEGDVILAASPPDPSERPQDWILYTGP